MPAQPAARPIDRILGVIGMDIRRGRLGPVLPSYEPDLIDEPLGLLCFADLHEIVKSSDTSPNSTRNNTLSLWHVLYKLSVGARERRLLQAKENGGDAELALDESDLLNFEPQPVYSDRRKTAMAFVRLMRIAGDEPLPTYNPDYRKRRERSLALEERGRLSADSLYEILGRIEYVNKVSRARQTILAAAVTQRVVAFDRLKESGQ